jgi:hypothetical protein
MKPSKASSETTRIETHAAIRAHSANAASPANRANSAARRKAKLIN